MINNVRNTVLTILSKDNRGYLTPAEFNLLADQAQKEIFENYFYQYSIALSKQNNRLHGSGYSNIPKRMAEVIDLFMVPGEALVYDDTTYATPIFELPAEFYKLENVIYNDVTEVDYVTKQEARMLNSAKLTRPNITFPIYTIDEEGIRVYPDVIDDFITADYIRYPKAPKWTWVSLSGGEPLFNQSALDYQDFELPLSDENNLIIKILQYAGLTIREADIVQAAKSEEIQDKQEKN
jgi:hypothetical protein